MSSIDKGVEQVVSRLGRNVKVQKRGNTIYGIMNGEVIFSLADRYGYINSSEEQIIRDGIRRYDEEERLRRERIEAENRARREAIQRAKEEAERQRREMLERERQTALRELNCAISAKRSELARSVENRVKAEKDIDTAMKRRDSEVNEIAKLSSLLDLSEIRKRNTADSLSSRAEAENITNKYRERLEEFDDFAKTVKNNMTTDEYRALMRRVGKFVPPTENAGNFEYENNKALQELRNIKQTVRDVLPVIAELEGLKNAPGEAGIVANTTLKAIASRKICGVSDVCEIIKNAEERLTRIAEIAEDEQIGKDIADISKIKGAIAACQKTYEIAANSTYTKKDFREEIEKNAIEAISGFRELASAAYSTCSSSRMREAIGRLETIIEKGESGENILREVDKLKSEAEAYSASDKLHMGEYEDYLSMVKALGEYGVSSEGIEKFDASNYSAQKKNLMTALAAEKREFERSQLIITDMQVKTVMESMGYELFSSIGDADGYVREALFTKPGYDGVLWQAVIYANGSVTRRVIGVNKGETETDIEYIKEVAAEMEKNKDPEEFISQFKEESGSKIAVNAATDHDSENADEVIKRNGYHYLSGAALELYNRKVESRPTAQTKTQQTSKSVSRQKRIVAGKAVANSSAALREAATKSRAMCHAN